MGSLCRKPPRSPAQAIAAVVVLLFLPLSPLPAAPPHPLKGALSLLAQAQEASRQGRHGDSLALLESAYRLERHPKILARMAFVHGKLGHPITAADLARRLLPGFPDAPQLRAELLDLQRPVRGDSAGEVQVEGAVRALLLVDQHPLGELPLALPLWLAPGVHALHLELGGAGPARQVTVVAGSRQTVRLEVPAAMGGLTVAADAPAVTLSVNGRPLGTLPFRGSVPAGALLLEAREAGQTRYRRTLHLDPGGALALQWRWQRAPRPRWRLVVGALGAAAGLALTGFGVHAALANHACVRVDSAGPCQTSVDPESGRVKPVLIDATAETAGLLGAGLALIIGGGLLVTWPGARTLADEEGAAARAPDRITGAPRARGPLALGAPGQAPHALALKERTQP